MNHTHTHIKWRDVKLVHTPKNGHYLFHMRFHSMVWLDMASLPWHLLTKPQYVPSTEEKMYIRQTHHINKMNNGIWNSCRKEMGVNLNVRLFDHNIICWHKTSEEYKWNWPRTHVFGYICCRYYVIPWNWPTKLSDFSLVM